MLLPCLLTGKEGSLNVLLPCLLTGKGSLHVILPCLLTGREGSLNVILPSLLTGREGSLLGSEENEQFQPLIISEEPSRQTKLPFLCNRVRNF